MNRLPLSVALFALVGISTCLAAVDAPGGAPSIGTPLPRPGMGWTTFNFFLAKHNHQLFERMADAFVASGMRDAGYDILRMDGGWWGEDSNRRWYYWTQNGTHANGTPYQAGDPHVEPRNYPGGIKSLATAVHQRSLKLGFYLSPSLSMGMAENYPDNGDAKVQPSLSGLALVDRHAAFVADSGLDHLFYDGYDWSQSQGTEPYVRMFQRLRSEAQRVNRPIALSINSGWSWRTPDYADEWRTSTDINGEWSTINQCLAAVANPAPGGNGRWSNPDCLMVGYLGDTEAQSQMSLWCVLGAPLYVSHDHRVMSVWDRYVLLNTEAIAVDQDPGLQGRRVRGDVGGVQVWARTLHDGSRGVVLYNNGTSTTDISVTWSELGLPGGGARVRDLWAHQDLGAFASGFTASAVPPRACRMLRVVAGTAAVPAPAATWAPHPGAKPAWQPLARAGLTVTGNLFNDPGRLIDGDNGGAGSTFGYQVAGRSMQIDLGTVRRVDRLVLEHQAVGSQVWPTAVYAPRSTYRLEASQDGSTFATVLNGTFGPAYTLATFAPIQARYLRMVLVDIDRITAIDDPTLGAREVHVFDTGAAPPPPSGNQPPTSAITAPASGAAFTAPAAITISANAGDADGSVAKVQFFNGGNLLGEDTSAPYALSWSDVPAGTYALTARATDNLGAATTSTAVSVTVTATPPPPPSGSAVYVSDLPYQVIANAWGPVEKDRSNGDQAAGDGLTLTIAGTSFAKGLGVHAPSEIRVALNGGYSRFRATVGIDDEVGDHGSVVFEAWADGAKLYDSGVRTGAAAGATVDIDVTGKTQLRLVVTDAGDAAHDHADWADARLVPSSGTGGGGGGTGGLPSGWASGAIGSPAVAGSASASNGTWTVTGSGADIWANADAGHLAYQALSGDGQIVARVVSQTNTDPWAKAGVMIRESNAAGSRHAMVVATPSNGLAFQRRPAAGGATSHTSGSSAGAPCWVKLERLGNTMSGYQSANGSTWQLIGSATIPMATDVLIGLTVTSHRDGTLSTAIFDNVVITAAVSGPG